MRRWPHSLMIVGVIHSSLEFVMARGESIVLWVLLRPYHSQHLSLAHHCWLVPISSSWAMTIRHILGHWSSRIRWFSETMIPSSPYQEVTGMCGQRNLLGRSITQEASWSPWYPRIAWPWLGWSIVHDIPRSSRWANRNDPSMRKYTPWISPHEDMISWPLWARVGDSRSWKMENQNGI